MAVENVGERTFVTSLMREWLDWLEQSKGHSDGTVRLYRAIGWKWLAAFGDRAPASVTPDEIERWLRRERGGRAGGNTASPATQRRDVAVVRGFYSYLRGRGYVHADPTELVATPSVRNVQPKPISDALWEQLWPTARGADAVALGLGFFCGLRREELTKLRVHHLDVGQRRLVHFVRKGGGEDVLPIGTMLDVFSTRLPHLGSDSFWPRLVAHADGRAGNNWLLGWTDLGKPRKRTRTDLEPGQLDPQHMNHWLDRMTRHAEVPHLHPHRLRHSTCTNLLRAGVPLAIVSNLMNHASIQTTMRYAKQGSDALSEWWKSAE